MTHTIQSTNLNESHTMTKSEQREMQIISKYRAAGLGPDYVARAISALIRAARSQKSAAALRAHALAYGVTDHPEFKI
jgi:ABC-type antimicrobial peptide transport system ATPase subunit